MLHINGNNAIFTNGMILWFKPWALFHLCLALYRKLGDGLFLQCCKEVAAGYPDITFDNMIVDNTTMQVSAYQHAFRD